MKSRSILHGIILMLVNKAIGRTKRDGRVHGAESVTRIQKKILTEKLAWVQQGMRTSINWGPEQYR